MLNTPRSAHKEILGAKFASFERAAVACWYIGHYAAKMKSVQWMTEPNKHLWVAIEPLFTHQHSLYCHTKEPLFHTNSGSVGAEKRLFLYIMGATALQNTIKTASEISKSDFYFVTDFTPIRDKIAISCVWRQIREFSSHAIRHGLYIKNRKRLFCP